MAASLPTNYGHWNSVFKRYDHWIRMVIWDELFAVVCVDADLQEVFIDNTVVHAYACVTDVKKSCRDRDIRMLLKGFSCKIYALTDALGYSLRFIFPLSQADVLVSAIPIKRLMANKGYISKVFVEYLENQGYEVLIPSKSNMLGHLEM
jgi:transposase